MRVLWETTHLRVTSRDGAGRVVVAYGGDDVQDVGTRRRGRCMTRDGHGRDGGHFCRCCIWRLYKKEEKEEGKDGVRAWSCSGFKGTYLVLFGQRKRKHHFPIWILRLSYHTQARPALL